MGSLEDHLIELYNMWEEILFTDVVVTTVEPLEKMAHVESIDPTDFDMMALDSYVPLFLAYRLAENSDAVYVQAVNRLKEGLRKVLVPFFPWAGRWVTTPGGMRRRLLCNDKGVPFIEAYVDKDMDSVVQFSVEFQPVPELQGWDVLGMKTMTTKQQMLPDGLPGAFVQVTRFKCGGLIVAVTASHMLADGWSIFHFLTAWSDLSRTNKTDQIIDHNRGAVQPSTPRPLPPVDVVTEFEVKVYEVSASVIESLKREVKKRADGSYVTTDDCIYAHVWKTVSSLPFSINGGKEICMVSAVEGRSRFYDRPVPNLLGNVFARMTSPDISTADLLNMPLSLIASKIREKLKTTPKETWLSPETQGASMAIFMSDQVIPWGLMSLSRFQCYSVDFGFGKPLFWTAINAKGDGGPMQGIVIVHPPTPGVSSSAACVAILLTNSQLGLREALESHPDFLPFFLSQEKVVYRHHWTGSYTFHNIATLQFH